MSRSTGKLTYGITSVTLALVIATLAAPLVSAQRPTDPGFGTRASVPAVQHNTGRGSVPAVQQTTEPGAENQANVSFGNFGMIDFPLANGSSAIGLNDKGQVVGGYGGSDVFSNPNHSFVLKGTSFKAINYPGAVSTEANAINDHGVVVGYYTDSAGNVHGFQLSGSTYKSIDNPKAANPWGTVSWGINNAGEIVGGYWDGTKSHA